MFDWFKRIIRRNDASDEITLPRNPDRCCETCDSLVDADDIEGHCMYWHESHKLVDSCAAWHRDVNNHSNDAHANTDDNYTKETEPDNMPYGTIATRNAPPFKGYTSKPNPSMMPTGNANIGMHRFVSTQESADELVRMIRSAHEQHEQRQDDAQDDGGDSDSDGNSDYQAEFERLMDESDEYYSSLRRDPIDD